MKSFLFVTWLMMSSLFAQSNVTGPLPLSLVDGGTDCDGLGRIVEVHADATGLSGDMGAALGLNAFKLVIQVDRNSVITTLLPGKQPISWRSVQTDANMVSTTITLTGWSSDTTAPNQSYLLASLLLTGDQGPVSVSLGAASEVASRLVVPGNGPELLSLQLPPAIQVTIPITYTLTTSEGIASWRQINSTYDLVSPMGPVDVLDLSKLVYCTP